MIGIRGEFVEGKLLCRMQISKTGLIGQIDEASAATRQIVSRNQELSAR